MNFQPVLIGLAFCGALQAQGMVLRPRGGGELRIANQRYRFQLTDLSTAPPKGGLPGAIRLEGNLQPQDGSGPFHLVLTVLAGGSLYMLQIQRKRPGGYPDNWAATLKTHTHALKWVDRPGGRIEIQCEGSLTGIIAKQPKEAEWSGTLWGIFPGGGEELSF